jgi:transposase-like protein
MPRRRYTHAEKAAFVAQAEIEGVTATAEKMGIPRKTGEYWLDSPRFAELRQKTREEMRDGFRVLVHKAQERLEMLVPTMEPRDLIVLMGVSTEKALLVGGDATARSEVNTYHGYNDHEKRAAADLIRSAVAADSTESGPAGDAVGAGVETPGPAGADSPAG